MAEINNEIVDTGFDPNSWESLDEKQISDEVNGLISRINNVAKLVERVIMENDCSKTEKEFSNLWMNDLGPSGFVPLFYNTNLSVFKDYPNENNAPPWYSNLPAESRKNFDACHRFFLDASRMVKPMEDLSRMMAKLPLVEAFKFMRITLNFDEAGYGTDLYHRIDSDMKEVAHIINMSWDAMERNAVSSERYYNANAGGISRDELVKGYRLERIRDYQNYVASFKASESFLPYADGSYGVRSARMVDMRVIDKYTMKVASLDNIEDDMKNAQTAIREFNALANGDVAKNLKSKQCMGLLDALTKLAQVIYDFTEGCLHVWTSYKDRDDDAPYCFIRKLPALSAMNGRYGFSPVGGDPWHDGTSFEKLYDLAASALSDHCYDFVYNHGHTGLK